MNMGGTVTTAAPGGIADTGIGAALVQVSLHRAAPPPPPETFGPYSSKTETGNGVIAMIDLLIKDLDKEMQEAGVTEKDAQGGYETMMSEAAAKRVADSKSITDKSAAKASNQESMQSEEDAKGDSTQEHLSTLKFIASLHGECDWLVKYFEVRKQARASEVESLTNAKAVSFQGRRIEALKKAQRALQTGKGNQQWLDQWLDQCRHQLPAHLESQGQARHILQGMEQFDCIVVRINPGQISASGGDQNKVDEDMINSFRRSQCSPRLM